MKQAIDLNPEHHKIVSDILYEYIPDRKVLVFGSRAKWTAKNASDLDLCIMGDKELPSRTLSKLAEAFDESALPFKVDLVEWATTEDRFREIIRKDGKELGWPIVRLQDFIKVEHGYAFDGQGIKDQDNGQFLVTPGNFRIGGGFKEDTTKFFHGAPPTDYILSQDDLVVTMTDLSKEGDTLGFPAFIPSNENRAYLHNQRIGKVVFKSEGVDKDFLYYVLCSQQYRHEILASATGTSIKHTAPKRIEAYSFMLPPYQEQIKIGDTLKSLDRKIENNQCMNRTLENLARGLFKSWFIDFDPVRAKAEGLIPEGMGAQTAKLFPSKFNNDGVPEGWNIKPLSDCFDFTMGQSPPGNTYNENSDGIPFFQGRRDFDLRYPTYRVYCTAPTRFANAGDTLLSVRAPVGDVNQALERCCIGRGVAALRHKTGSASYTYYAMQSLRDIFASYDGEGTVFGSINKISLGGLQWLEPDSKVVAAYDEIVSKIDGKIKSNSAEIHILAESRDALLPKLISGQIRIGESESKYREAM